MAKQVAACDEWECVCVMREVLFVVAEEASHPRLRGGFLAKRRDCFVFRSLKIERFCTLFIHPELSGSDKPCSAGSSRFLDILVLFSSLQCQILALVNQCWSSRGFTICLTFYFVRTPGCVFHPVPPPPPGNKMNHCCLDTTARANFVFQTHLVELLRL